MSTSLQENPSWVGWCSSSPLIRTEANIFSPWKTFDLVSGCEATMWPFHFDISNVILMRLTHHLSQEHVSRRNSPRACSRENAVSVFEIFDFLESLEWWKRWNGRCIQAQQRNDVSRRHSTWDHLPFAVWQRLNPDHLIIEPNAIQNINLLRKRLKILRNALPWDIHLSFFRPKWQTREAYAILWTIRTFAVVNAGLNVQPRLLSVFFKHRDFTKVNIFFDSS